MASAISTTPSVLFVHNRYRQSGGEEAAIGLLQSMLPRRGWNVARFENSSDAFLNASIARKTILTAQIPFSLEVYFSLQKKIRETGARLLHAHNIFPFISPSVYSAARRARVPVIHTLHNYRVLCVNGLFLRDGKPCELCIGGNTLHAVGGKCYGGSVAQSAVMAANLALQRAAGTWRRGADAFVALSNFSKKKFVEGGLPEERIHVQPNFLDVASYPFEAKSDDYILFLGRLSKEKGLKTLLAAYEILAARMDAPPLEIIGEGPLENYLKDFMKTNPALSVRWHGRLEGSEKIARLKKAALLVFPSECYENCPLTVLESFAVGTPVLGTRLGGTQELIREGETGSLFSAGDPESLAETLKSILSDKGTLADMRAMARKEAETRFNESVGMDRLLSLYERVSSRFRP